MSDINDEPTDLELSEIDAEAIDAMESEGGHALAAVDEQPAPPELPPAPPGTFPTHMKKGGLRKFRVACEGHRTLEGMATDESEAIRAYRLHVGIDETPGRKTLKLTAEPA